MTKSDGMCEYDSQVNKCVPDISKDWGPMTGEVKQRRAALDKYYRTPNPLMAPGVNMYSWLQEKGTCNYSADDCVSKSEGKCEVDPKLKMCVPNLNASWGAKYDDIKNERDAIFSTFSAMSS